MRNLASVKRIKEIKPAENSDNLNLAYVDGWQVVVRKDENYQVGDLCVYIEIDSMLPDTEPFKFLTGKKIHRLRTVKLRSNLSQGLIMPLSCIPEDYYMGGGELTEDQDVTELLEITKYEPPFKFEQGQAKGDFPTHLVDKTDETRIQSSLKALEEFEGLPYYISVKCDGTSFTCLYMDDVFEVCSRGNRRKEDDSCVYWKVAKKYNLQEKLAEHKNWIVQGECCGPSIQSNKLALKDHDLFVFNIYDSEQRKFLGFWDFIKATETLGVQTVPIMEVGNAFHYELNELLGKAVGTYKGTDNQREGIVIRTQEEGWSPTLGRRSFKVINNEFLLEQTKKNSDDE
jgi:RNA ligase (TIGR02306 family)